MPIIKPLPFVTVLTGLALLVLGVTAWIRAGAGAGQVTALIPAAWGLPVLVLGLLANRAGDRLRMHLMHGAVLLGLLGFLFPAVMAGPHLPQLLSTGQVIVATKDGGTRDATSAVIVQCLMASFCLVFTGLCVNSFVQARRRRAAAGNEG